MARNTTTTATFAEYAPFFAASPATAISVVHGDTFAVVTRDGHVIPCESEAESARVMELLTRPGAVVDDAALFRCTCGRTVRHTSPANGYDKCPWCNTFPSPDLGATIDRFHTGHRFWGGDDTDWRCMDCDTRHHSHRKYAGDADYTWTVDRAAKSYADTPTL